VLSKKCMCWCFIHYWIEKCTVKQWNCTTSKWTLQESTDKTIFKLSGLTNLPLRNSQPDELHVYQLHTECRTKMVQHQNKVSYDPETA